MSKRDPMVRLLHMRDHAREALQLGADKSRQDLESDRLLILALTRLVEVIGEAASQVPAGIRQRHPEIPWGDIIGMRNRLIHGYDVIDADVLWRTLKKDLAPLIVQLEAAVQAEQAE